MRSNRVVVADVVRSILIQILREELTSEIAHVQAELPVVGNDLRVGKSALVSVVRRKADVHWQRVSPQELEMIRRRLLAVRRTRIR